MQKESDLDMDKLAQQVFKDHPFAFKIKKPKKLTQNTIYQAPSELKKLGSDREPIFIPNHGKKLAKIITFTKDRIVMIPGIGKVNISKDTQVAAYSINHANCFHFINKAPTVPTRVTDQYNQILDYLTISEDGKPIYSKEPPTTPQREFTHSYEIDNNRQIMRKGKVIGRGGFGAVKKASIVDQQPTVPDIVIKTQQVGKITEKRIEKEFEILKNLGHTAGELTFRGKKAIIPLKNFGTPLSHRKNDTFDTKLSQSIDLLLAVDRLHKGTESSKQEPIAHCDIKPDNILIDEKGVLHLIDYGMANSELNDTPKGGTLLYLPIDLQDLEDRRLPKNIFKYISLKHNIELLDTDKIATLRSIYHPVLSSTQAKKFGPGISIFTHEEFTKLPEPLQKLLDTKKINPFVNNEPINEKMIASALTYYQLNKNITNSDVQIIANNPKFQDSILNVRNAPPATKAIGIELIQIERHLIQQINRIENNINLFSNKQQTTEKLSQFRDQLGSTRALTTALKNGNPVAKSTIDTLHEDITKTSAIQRGVFANTTSTSKFNDFKNQLNKIKKDAPIDPSNENQNLKKTTSAYKP